MKHLRLFSLLTAWVFLASSAFATTPPPAEETTGVQHAAPSPGPVVVNWHFKKGQGLANLIVNPDGTYLFSGNYKDKMPGKDFHIVLALKSSLGGVYRFHYVGNASNGVQWSKQGKSAILKDDFKTFTKHDWAGSYRFWLTAEGRAQLERQKDNQYAECQYLISLGWLVVFNGSKCVSSL